MNKEDSKLITIYIEEDNIYTCYIKSLPFYIVQVEKIEDAPKEIAKLLEVQILFSIKSGNVDMGEYVIE